MLKKALETSNSLHKGPRWGTWWGGVPFSWTFERWMDGSGNGGSLINLIWTTFGTQIILGA
jgi:hypothetical protein